MFYAEESTGDSWAPVTYTLKPETKNNRIKQALGLGPRIRNIQQIFPEHASLTLEELKVIYGTKCEGTCTC